MKFISSGTTTLQVIATPHDGVIYETQSGGELIQGK
jgi:hypothetical protein